MKLFQCTCSSLSLFCILNLEFWRSRSCDWLWNMPLEFSPSNPVGNDGNKLCKQWFAETKPLKKGRHITIVLRLSKKQMHVEYGQATIINFFPWLSDYHTDCQYLTNFLWTHLAHIPPPSYSFCTTILLTKYVGEYAAEVLWCEEMTLIFFILLKRTDLKVGKCLT